jgi:hypothetical protein
MHAKQLAKALQPTLIIIVRHPCGYAASVSRGRGMGLLPVGDRLAWFRGHRSLCASLGFGSETQVLNMSPCEFLGLEWLVQNISFARVHQSYQPTYRVIYEDLCQDPFQVARDTFDFLGWPFQRETLRYIQDSIQEKKGWSLGRGKNRRDYFGLNRNPLQAAWAWHKNLTEKEIDQVLSVAKLFPDFSRLWPDNPPSAGVSPVLEKDFSKAEV